MGPKRKGTGSSPAQTVAKRVKARYSRHSPGKVDRVRRALLDVQKNKVSIRKAADKYSLSYGYLHRRLSGEVDIESRNGPPTIFSMSEEEAMAKWLNEMSARGMGLKPGEFLDFVQKVVNEQKKTTPFKEGRPGYDWYKAFMSRNSHIVQIRQETPLEACRAKLSKSEIDKWYSAYRDFVMKLGLVDKPKRIFNADESGFSLGSKAGKVIGPRRTDLSQVPHVTGGHSKQRLTVMFCGSADGAMLPPYFVYPSPPPRGYNPLSGAIENSGIAYTTKGWMDSMAFKCFLEHFNKHCGQERPVILIIDSVSSHVFMDAFEYAKSKGIELYRLHPNATHIMQPLDVGVFGPLKKRWHQVLRRYSRENPGKAAGKENFPELLKEAFLMFYKPLTIINSFKSAGIYPIDSTVITSSMLKPGITFGAEEEAEISTSLGGETGRQEEQGNKAQHESAAHSAFCCLENALETPVRNKYKERIEEDYDVDEASPCFKVYKQLYFGAHVKPPSSNTTSTVNACEDCASGSCVKDASTSAGINQSSSGLELLASVVCSTDNDQESAVSTNTESFVNVEDCNLLISPVLKKHLVLPKAEMSTKPKRNTLLQDMPHNLTSPNALRKMALKELQKVRQFASKEKTAKNKYLKQLCKKASTSSSYTKSGHKKAKKSVQAVGEKKTENTKRVKCMGCHMSWQEEQHFQTGSIWIQCDKCDGWIHKDCCSNSEEIQLGDDDVPFVCPECQ